MDFGPTSYREIDGKRQSVVFQTMHRRRKTIVKMTLQARLMQAHLMLLVAQQDEHGFKFVPLARHGAYEVRLVEFAGRPAGNFIFWIELFDCNRRVSIDSGGANDVEDASAIADHLALRAEELAQN